MADCPDLPDIRPGQLDLPTADKLADRVVDVMRKLLEMTLLLRGRGDYLLDRYSERNERALKAIDRQIARS